MAAFNSRLDLNMSGAGASADGVSNNIYCLCMGFGGCSIEQIKHRLDFLLDGF